MEAVHLLIENSQPAAWIFLIISFIILSKCADIFVDSSVGIANKLRIPRLLIGIVLVSFATTAPELSVSMISALQDKPAMALGNAIGSIICDDGLALALAGLVSATAIPVPPRVLNRSGLFLVVLVILIFLFVVFDLTLSRWEGIVLFSLFIGYSAYLYRMKKKGYLDDASETFDSEAAAKKTILSLFLIFITGLAGIIISSEFIVSSATSIALHFNIPEAIIALTLVAFGTSIPEVATCITAARKKEGAIAVGNILGADIMNICWVAGASSIANDLTLGKKEMYFMFPSMFIMVGTMLLLLKKGYNLNRKKGAILLGFYILYLFSFFIVFP